MLVAKVALGTVKELRAIDSSLTAAPAGFHSVQGVKTSADAPSAFVANEFVVYSLQQQALAYVIEYDDGTGAVAPPPSASLPGGFVGAVAGAKLEAAPPSDNLTRVPAAPEKEKTGLMTNDGALGWGLGRVV